MRWELHAAGRIHRVSARGLRIGRAEDVDLRLVDNLVSRRHAIVRATPSSLSIEDLESRDGIGVNGVRIKGTSPLDAVVEIHGAKPRAMHAATIDALEGALERVRAMFP